MTNIGFQKSNKAIVHIGHGKTGSSAIQSYLAKHRDDLADYDIRYPFHRSIAWAKEGQVSSGNGRLVLDTIDAGKHDLYSDETLCARLKDDHIAYLHSCYPGGVKFLCYTRDFFDHAISAWGQNIKRSGYKHDFRKFIKNVYGGHLTQLLTWLERSDETAINLQVFNYSRHRSHIVEHFIACVLGKDNSHFTTLHAPKKEPVNRSLTLAEYELQRLMNIHFPKKTSTFVSDVLVNELPHIPAERPPIDKAIYDFAANKFGQTIEAINSFLPISERVIFEPFDTLKDNNLNPSTVDLTFSPAQLETLVKSLSYALLQPDIGRLERIADGYIKNEPLWDEDAEYLFAVLHRLRPNDPKYTPENFENESVAKIGRRRHLRTTLSKVFKRLKKSG